MMGLRLNGGQGPILAMMFGLLPACGADDTDASDDAGAGIGVDAGRLDDMTVGDGVAPGTLVVSVNGETPITLSQSNLLVNNAPGVPANAVYTSFGAQTLPNTVLITFPGDTTGAFTCSDGASMPRVQFSRTGTAESGDTQQTNGTCTVVVTEFGAAGGVIRGTFEAHTENTTGTFDLTDGAFAINRP